MPRINASDPTLPRTTASAPDTQALSVGSRGDDVKFVQGCLQAQGLLTGSRCVDGVFGRQTAAAVRNFQASAGLPATGAVDGATLRALESRVPRGQTVDAPTPRAPADEATVQGSRRRGAAADERQRAQVEQGPASLGTAAARPRSGLFGLFGRRASESGAGVDRASSVRVPADQEARAGEYRSMVAGAGGRWRTGVRELNVVGLRGQDVDGRKSNEFNRFNDTIAFVWKGDDGRMNVREFRATTDPGVGRSAFGLGVDVDGDGRKDVGHVMPGQYTYRAGPHRGMSGAARPDSTVVARDTNGDGTLSQAEASRRSRGGGHNLHWAWSNAEENGGRPLATEVNSSSEGCQVIALSRGDFLKHVTPLIDLNARRDFPYTLIDQTR
jgi:hypothetical protein